MTVYQGNFPGRNLTTPQPPGGGDDMNLRLTKLETRVETILPTLATKSDIAETKTAIATAESGIVKWLSGIVIGVVSLAVAIILFAFNRVSPPQSQSAQPVIVYPMQQSAPSPSPGK